MKKILTFCFVFFAIVSFAQKTKNGTYVYRFFDEEYHKFNGTCRVIIKGDSITAIAMEDCHRAKGDTIENGLLKYRKDNKKWVIINFDNNDTDPDNYHSSIDTKKKIFYTM